MHPGKRLTRSSRCIMECVSNRDCMPGYHTVSSTPSAQPRTLLRKLISRMTLILWNEWQKEVDFRLDVTEKQGKKEASPRPVTITNERYLMAGCAHYERNMQNRRLEFPCP